jgi:hypothetical protein
VVTGNGEARGAARGGKTYDLGAVRRVPGGIASHRVTIQLVAPARPPAAADARE